MHFIMIVLVLISTSVFADDSTWLCIGEHMATVSEKNGISRSDSFLNDEKWIITKDGLKYFGTDNVIFDTCNRDKNGRPHWCERSDGLWSGIFMMQKNNAFFFNGASQTEKEGNKYYWVVGKCSKL